MRRLLARTAPVGAVVVANLASGTALTDAIDGDWCHGDRKLSIDGPEIVTPEGTAMTGSYDRHAFAYVVPDHEPDAGDQIYMQQLSEESMRLMVGSWTAEAEMWHRCEFVS